MLSFIFFFFFKLAWVNLTKCSQYIFIAWDPILFKVTYQNDWNNGFWTIVTVSPRKAEWSSAVLSEQCVPLYTNRHSKQSSNIKRDIKKREQNKTNQQSLHPPLFQIVFGFHHMLSQDAPCQISKGRSMPTYKSSLCSAEVEPGKSFIAEIQCTSSHFSWLMVDTSGYWKIISVVG